MKSGIEIPSVWRRSKSSIYRMLSSRHFGEFSDEHGPPVLLDDRGGELGTDLLNHRRARNEPRVREPREEDRRAEVVVAVFMGDVDSRDMFAFHLHPVGKGH